MVGDTGIPSPNVYVHVPILHDEGMFQQLLILWPVLVVFKQAVPDERAKFCGESLVWGKARGILLNHFSQHLKLGLAVFVGELAGGELHQGDPQAPHVGPDVVVRLVLVEKMITTLIFTNISNRSSLRYDTQIHWYIFPKKVGGSLTNLLTSDIRSSR